MNQKFLKIGVIGLGGRMDGFLKWAFVKEVENFAVVAVTDINYEKTMERFKESPNVYASDARYYTDPDEMLDKEELDGVFVGTGQNTHVEMALKVIKRGIPLFLEKPVAIGWDDLNLLNEARKKYNPKCLVSFPLRQSLQTQEAKRIIESGKLGEIHHVQAYNDVSYGRTYFKGAFNKHPELSGGLWLEKATHDLDVINYLMGEIPEKLCAMWTKGFYGGNMPAGITCDKCDKRLTCPESDYTITRIYREKSGSKNCCFDVKNPNQDCGTVIAKYPSGAHIMYAQNFYARFQAGRRGARYYGYKGTMEHDINNHVITIYMHNFDRKEVIKFDGILDPHAGGDEVLSRDFAALMRGENIKSTLLEGIQSAAFGICAREACIKDEYISFPDLG